MGDGVFELRLKFGSGYRIYFCLKNRRIIILLFGGDKSSQVKDIEFAKKLLVEFKARSYEK